MTTTALPEIQSEYDVWNLAPGYWVQVDAWGAGVGYERELGVYKIFFKRYPTEGSAYRQALFAVEPPGGRADLGDISIRLAEAHGIDAPDWLAPSLIEMVRLMDERAV